MKDEKWFIILPGRLSYDGVKMLRSGNPHGRNFHNLVYGIFCLKNTSFFLFCLRKKLSTILFFSRTSILT